MLTTLNKNVFKVWFINTTGIELMLNNNSFNCDIRMQWILELENITNKNTDVPDTDKCQTCNILIKCWFSINKDICQSVNKQYCGPGKIIYIYIYIYIYIFIYLFI